MMAVFQPLPYWFSGTRISKNRLDGPKENKNFTMMKYQETFTAAIGHLTRAAVKSKTIYKGC